MASFRDPFISNIADDFWHDASEGKELPWGVQLRCDPNERFGVRVKYAVIQQDERVHLQETRNMFALLNGKVGLQRRKTKRSIYILTDNPVNGPVAKLAVAIKKNNGMVHQ